MTDIHDLIQKATEIAKGVIRKESAIADKEGIWVSESMAALKESRLTALTVPINCGGHGQGLYALARVCEELGKGYASAGLCFGMHCVGTAVIAAKATEWQKKNYLEPIAGGTHLTTLALSEPGTGAHFYIPQTSLLPLSANEYLINGSKTFVTNGGHVDSYVLSTVAAADEARADEFSCIVLNKDTEGIQWGQEWDGLGMRGNASRSLKLTNVRITDQHILGEKGEQIWYVFNVVAPYFLTAMSGTYLGIAQRALEEAQATVSKRVYAHNGTALAQVSNIQHRLGMLWANVERTRQLIYHAALLGDKGDEAAVLSLLAAKAEVASCAVDTANEALTLAGGIGYQHNGLLGMLMRDARAAHVMAPTTDILYTWIGRALLDQPLLSD
ncbi:MAG TPA: acyl-CoA dehydrogenase family protein [Chitinophagaceae bacterium]|nr:acyl-CoA dehydrogenase family protein [Chitinophagaceae bacterium]